MPPIVIQPIAIRPTTIEFHICDHTATVEIKVWTSVMDIILTACGIAAPEQGVGDKDKLIETLRSKCWSCRCIIVEETAYANRPERNRLQMVSIVEQSWKFKGTKRGLFALNPEYPRSGLPYESFATVWTLGTQLVPKCWDVMWVVSVKEHVHHRPVFPDKHILRIVTQPLYLGAED